MTIIQQGYHVKVIGYQVDIIQGILKMQKHERIFYL